MNDLLQNKGDGIKTIEKIYGDSAPEQRNKIIGGAAIVLIVLAGIKGILGLSK